MAYFRNLDVQVTKLLQLLNKDQRWLILMNADPDAMASALALKRILARRVNSVALAHVNEISRPDNLAMMRLLRIPTKKLIPTLAAQYDHFALVDSQPHHHPEFASFEFSIVIDHHPLLKDHPPTFPLYEIRPDYGANSTLMTEMLYNMGLRPGKLLATALLYGIKTDTQSFEREFHDADIKAFRYLTKFYNPTLLHKITRSEFRVDWLRYFSQAFRKMRILGNGLTAFLGAVDSPDILVILADFFMRVHGLSWVLISGLHDEKLVLVFRGDGLRRDMGKFAQNLFGDLGSAGGHRSMARAEIPLEKIGNQHAQQFILERLARKRKKNTVPKSTTE
jgi:nanoRNase/pAp phosphatase (c-di-AMP/oligoRNAs hydrolase)